MCSKKVSLFDELLTELDHDLIIKNPTIQSDTMVSYSSNRTGREAFMSYARYMAITSLRPGLIKRYIGLSNDCPVMCEKVRHAAAVSEFLEDNARCEIYNEMRPLHGFNAFVELVIGEARLLLSDSLDEASGSVLNFGTVSSGLHVGPGASSGVLGDNCMYTKLFEGPMTFSSDSVRKLYKSCTTVTRLTYVAEAIRQEMYGCNDSVSTNAIFLSVPKTNVKNRGICTQPSGNMVLQLATHEILSEALRSDFKVDLQNQQELNRRLAQIGSTGQTAFENESWNFCTLDLSRASNFPLILLELFLPDNWVKWLCAIRSPSIEIDGVVVTKHMCSTMGNGFTFSLMTILLSAIVKACYSLAALPELDTLNGVPIKTWAVYGDDIIVDKRVFNGLVKVLDACGFLVNVNKTFSEGLFRESCGGDFYNGDSVRPVFVETLQTQADIYSLLNRLVSWGVYHSVDLSRSLKFLRSKLGKDCLRVPNWEDVCAGLHVPFTHAVQTPCGVPRRIRSMLQNGDLPYECDVARTRKRILFIEKTIRVPYTEIKSRELLYYDSTIEVKVNALNQPGVLCCILDGSIRAGTSGLRPCGEVANYKRTWKIAPSWGDPSLFASSVASGLRSATTSAVYRLWEEYVRRNVF